METTMKEDRIVYGKKERWSNSEDSEVKEKNLKKWIN